jgi:formylglycine-generating enzyme required for sulfatase activity/predicted amidophosphoribosyltransferase
MKRCDPCGLKFEGRVLFCRMCGSLLVAPAGVVAYDDLPPTAKVKTCPRCEAPARFAWRFCSRCGADLMEDAAESMPVLLPSDCDHPGTTAQGLAVPTSVLDTHVGACPFCGTSMTREHKFCERCGFEVIRCASCDAIVPAADALFCDECGTSLDDPRNRATLREPMPTPLRSDPPVAIADTPTAPVAVKTPDTQSPQIARPPLFLAQYESQTRVPRRIRGVFVAVVTILVLGGGVVAASIAWKRWPAASPAATRTPAPPAPEVPPRTQATNEIPNPLEPPPGMVLIPGGAFVMGSDSGDEYERPEHRVVLTSFFIDATEVTCDAYARFLAETNRRSPAGWSGASPPKGSQRLPVTGVTWEDAKAYAAWAGKRLPTEAEWEYAARGSDGRRYPWGNEWKLGRANAFSSAVGRMAEVGSYPDGKSPFGVLDLSGNAWEWTETDLAAYPGGRLPAPARAGEKIIRGGCWKSTADESTTTYRWGWPARGAKDYGDTGFRCALNVPQPRTEER